MNKIYNTLYNETYYEETMENGLKVTVFHKPGYIGSASIFASPYGSLDFHQIINDKDFKCHLGAAHFLEHKLFEDEDKDIMNVFSSLGANVNAFTSYKETAYYFTTADKDIRVPLEELLNFVQQLKIDDASVNKEKGIITQEILMYQQMPDSRLLNETLKSMYSSFPLKYDIAGTISSVSHTTAKELYKVYNYNYHPSVMQLFVITAQDPKEIMETVRNNQTGKKFKKRPKIEKFDFQEPIEVCRKRRTLFMDIQASKVCLGFKLPVIQTDALNRQKLEFALRFILESIFSPSSELYQKWMDKGYITDYFSYDVDISEDYSMILFFNETDQPIPFKNRIIRQIEKFNPDKFPSKLLKQFSHRNYGESISLLETQEDYLISYMRSSFRNMNLFEGMNLPQRVTIEDMKEILSYFDKENYSLVQIKPLNK